MMEDIQIGLDLEESESSFLENLNYIKEKLQGINLIEFDQGTTTFSRNMRSNEIKRLLTEIDRKMIPFYGKYKNLFNNDFLGRRIQERVFDLKILLSGNDNFSEIYEEVGSLARRINDSFLRFKSQALFDTLEDELSNAKNEVINIKAAKLAIESNETDKIFIELASKYEDEYILNNEYFRNSLIVVVCCTFLSIIYTIHTPVSDINWPVFISLKILIIAVGITLCTLFLRRSSHSKKLYEKAYQTHVEINAYPIFIKSLKEEDQQEITKELALRYFGNDIDQTQNDKIGDLLQDQLVAGTELIRASAEIIRAKKGNEAE
ncbi:hypothetical protein WBV44_00100 [Acinetobacter baumannii]|uniref:hypothetical protein n=2 Tax=Acinetobacter baumannii TaxID=470 RepID=UPI0002AEB404|nr:hypothetical protein [Acinetobacter baumannii]ELX06790.1 hypothetical protein ACINNAV57_3030 [Acinetobacter baumannii Naval-57]MDC4750612.1 hypothetical protein [Acinetobacter baumannii]MDC4769522.1 hypothetical protein [Acinetobacter baumannii]MDH2612078.1 hypothetical protein [Acinetobacter baumannii]MDH2615533.1 hypothetical protein [Acinetobacter baumannii]